MPNRYAQAVTGRRRVAATSFIALFLTTPILSMTAHAEEPLPVFQASTLLPGAPLVGPNYRVDETVRNDGFLNYYTVTVDGESYTVASNALMRQRLLELAALQKMDELKRSDVYQEALKKGVRAPIDTATGLVTEPVETVRGVARGIGTFAESIGHSLFGGASDQEDGVMKTALGVDAAKRKVAADLGIDPYTSFPPVRGRLNEIAWAGAGGSLTVSAGFRLTPAPASGVLGAGKMSQGMMSLLAQKTPAELKDINANKLEQMRVQESVAELFLEHPKFSPTEKTLLVDALARTGVSDRQAFVQRAILVQDETMAYFMRRWAQLNAAYHRQVQRAARFVRLGRMPILQREDGVLIAIAPVDHLAWTDAIARRHATNMQSLSGVSNVTGGEIWIEGTISAQARAALEAQNWVVKENVGAQLTLQ